MTDEVVGTREIDKELGFYKWFTKVTERCNILQQCIKDRTPIKVETDYDIVEMLHRDWFNGECIIYETITIPDTTKSTQPSLFDDKSSDSPISFDDARDKILDGTEIDILVKETKKAKKK